MTAGMAAAPAVVVAFIVVLRRHLAVIFGWFGRTARLLPKNFSKGVRREDLLAEVAFALYALCCGTDGIHGLA